MRIRIDGHLAINKVRMRLLDYNGLLLKRIFIYVVCQETIVMALLVFVKATY
jgi:hypothetical protein